MVFNFLIMENKDELRDELKNLSVFLWEQKNKPEGFEVPKDYFKSLPDEVFAKLNERPKTAVEEKENWFGQLIKSLQYLFQPKYAFAYATVALLLVAGFYFLNNPSEPQIQQIALSDISDETLETYISENIDDFDEAILAEQLADNIERPFNELEIENDEELIDELIDDLNVEDLEDLL